MPIQLTPEQQAKFAEHMKAAVDRFQPDGENAVEPMPDDRSEFRADAAASSDNERFVHPYDRDNYVAFQRQRAANPYLSPAIRGPVDKLCNEMMQASASRNEQVIFVRALDDMQYDNKLPKPFRDRANEMFEAESGKTNAHFERCQDAMGIVEYLNGGKRELTQEFLKTAQEKFGIDLNSPEIQKGRQQAVRPNKADFTVEAVTGIDPMKFRMKMASTENPPPTLRREELEYGIATFDRNMNGLYGDGAVDVKPGNRMYLGKFDYIFMDGKSVNELCREQTQGMGDVERSDYMKCFTTAAAMSRDKRMECVPPPVNFTIEEDGKIAKQFSRARDEKAQPIPLIPQVEEKPPRVNIFKRILARLGLYQIRSFEQKKFDEMMEDDKGQVERDLKIESKVTSMEAAEMQAERDAIQQTVVEQTQGFVPAARLKMHDTFFHPDDMQALNPDIAESDRWLPKNLNGVSDMNAPTRRVGMAMAYMYAKGYPIDQIVDSDSLVDEKREIGKKLYEIMTGDDKKATAEMMAETVKAVSDMRIPDIDYTNDAALAENAQLLRFISAASISVDQNVRFKDPETKAAFDTALGEKGEDARARMYNTMGSGVMRSVEDRLTYIESSDYSTANPLRQGETSTRVAAVAATTGLREINETPGMRGARVHQVAMAHRFEQSGLFKSAVMTPLIEELDKDDMSVERAVRFLNGETSVNPGEKIIDAELKKVQQTHPGEGGIQVRAEDETAFEVTHASPEPERMIAVEPAVEEVGFDLLQQETVKKTKVSEKVTVKESVEYTKDVEMGK